MKTFSLSIGKRTIPTHARVAGVIVLIALGLAASLGTARADGGGTTTRVSVGLSGAQANGDSGAPTLSADGRYVAFDSSATNLVSGDTNATTDAFVYDRVTGITELVSVSSARVQGNYGSNGPEISADGRYVAFSSSATNLVPGNVNAYDIFLHDRVTGQTERSSVSSSGVQGNGDSGAESISDDGRYVAFDSLATNLDLNDTNATWDVYVHDRVTGQTVRASVNSSGVGGNNMSIRPCISGNGRFVAFWSQATNLVANDTNAGWDLFVRDLLNGATERVNVASDGTQSNGSINPGRRPSISDDGRYVAFHSSATNLVAGDNNGAQDVFVHDRQTGQTTRVSVASDDTQADGDSFEPRISGNGRYVAFYSSATNLVAGDNNGAQDVFVHDGQTGQTTRVSVASDGTQATGDSTLPAITPDGRIVAFRSQATNLVSGDTNGAWDVFVHMMPNITVEDTDLPIRYDGWRGVTDVKASGSSLRVSKVANDTASLTFKGASVTWLTLKGPDQGQAQVYIDGVDKGRFDNYTTSAKYQARRSFTGLTNANHTMTVKVLGTKSASATAANIVVDGFVVGANSTTEDTSPLITYNTWMGKSNKNASGGSFRTSATAGAVVQIQFSGTSVEWITAKGPGYGKARVLIDNAQKGGTIDLYAATPQWQAPISFTGLSAGTHVLKIQVLGAKNAKSSGTNVVVDAFYGPIATN